MKIFVNILLFILCFSFSMVAQVEIIEDPEVARLVQRHIDQNKVNTSISGWRIQLMASSNRRVIEEEEGRFIARYPTIAVFWEHSKPLYRLKAGAFATKLDATKVLKELKNTYPSAILTKSDVTYSELLN